ncbi:MAG: hypothetical protein GX883_10735, partial [Firmicutes bacterium]|nr:hypothetical protein [Bacillota bacterium]
MDGLSLTPGLAATRDKNAATNHGPPRAVKRGRKGNEKMKAKVASMVTTPVTESYKMKALYTAADSVFALPPYEQVLAYLESGPVPEPPDCVKDTPGGCYAVGRMISANGAPSVRIITDGGREVVVEPRRVAVFFRTATR